MANIKLALSSLIPVRLIMLFRIVIGKLTGSTVYTDPPFAPAAMNTLADAYQSSIEAAATGDKAAKAHRDLLTLQVEDMLKQTANYVRMVANGDREKLILSGFELAKEPQPVFLPAVPTNIIAKPGKVLGAADIKWPSIHGAHSYQLFITDKNPELYGSWTPLTVTTRVRYTATGLDSNKQYWFAVAAIGVNGQSMMSDPVLSRAA